ncbi:MAG: cupin domain-containing protein [Treponema sp.]|nr:cupin domain-containing protein [Treponema sp.]
MKNKYAGRTFSLAEENAPVFGCTISEEIVRDTFCFSLAPETDISAEIYPYHKFLIIGSGQADVYSTDGKIATLKAGQCILTKTGIPVGVRTKDSTVYTEIIIRRNEGMNKAITAGAVFKLADLVPYQENKIVNMDIINNEKMKFVVMAFDEGTGLSEHAAPGEALLFALDGEAVIGYEGEAYPIKQGENFQFAANGRHWIKADNKFKMALLLTLE